MNAELNFQCDKDSQNNEFTLDQWDGTNLKLSMKTKAACITSKEDKKKKNTTMVNLGDGSLGYLSFGVVFKHLHNWWCLVSIQ